MRKTDISKFTDKNESNGLNSTKVTQSTVKTALKLVGKAIATVFAVLFSAFIIVAISMMIYIFSIASEPTGVDLHARALNLSSHIYCENPETGKFEETQSLYGLENRVWVDFASMPKGMKDAIVAIEDKRFYDHRGVDWVRTGGAILTLASGDGMYGGSTITQQLIKNITDDDEVSLTRKLREIFRALNIENEYTKDEILEAYLNVVNFGNNCQGVEAASQLYFDKSISECSVAECAAIAGITQNPSLWNPLIYPENNKIRRETVLKAMYDQEKLTKAEYDAALAESANMTFVGFTYDDDEDDEDDSNVQSWYIDNLYDQLVRDLSVFYNISTSAASDKLLTEGLNIYCAVDLKAQEIMEKAALEVDADEDLQIGMSMVDMKGRILATVGSTQKKDGNLLWSRATDSVLQPGSSIKPLFVYPYNINSGEIHYSSYIEDKPLDNWFADGSAGPNNFYDGTKGELMVPDAIEWSSNCTAVQLMNIMGPRAAYDQAVTLMGFSHLDPEQDSVNTGGLSIGGLYGGVTVQEMAAAYCYVGNGGRYYRPYTYYYVTDSNDKIILDNRDAIPKQAYTPETAAIMNRLLHYNIEYPDPHTRAYYSRVDGWDIVGKTGTTDRDKDSWFCGVSPYCSLAIWTGFDYPHSISYSAQATAPKTFSKVMGQYLQNKEKKDFVFPESIVEEEYCVYSGLLATSHCTDTKIGYYTESNMPDYCYGGHGSDYDEEDETAEGETSPDNSDPSGTDEGTTTDGSTPSDGENDPSQPTTTEGEGEGGGEATEPSQSDEQVSEAPEHE